MDRDCKNCIYANWESEYDNGCTKWGCEYVSREEAIKAVEFYREYQKVFTKKLRDAVIDGR